MSWTLIAMIAQVIFIMFQSITEEISKSYSDDEDNDSFNNDNNADEQQVDEPTTSINK